MQRTEINVLYKRIVRQVGHPPEGQVSVFTTTPNPPIQGGPDIPLGTQQLQTWRAPLPILTVTVGPLGEYRYVTLTETILKINQTSVENNAGLFLFKLCFACVVFN